MPIATYSLASAVEPPPPSRQARRAKPGGRSLAELRKRLGGSQDRMMRELKDPAHVTVDIHYFKH